MSAKFPDALVIVREEISEAIVDTAASGEIDIFIEFLPFDETHLYVESLFLDEFYVADHQDNPLSRLDEIPINALENIPLYFARRYTLFSTSN